LASATGNLNRDKQGCIMSFTQIPPFFLVWNPRTGFTKHRHSTVQQAEAEAKRLSDLNMGVEFHVLLSLGYVKGEKE
jgi:hypothetical protein